jgi:hypothetical protein
LPMRSYATPIPPTSTLGMLFSLEERGDE